MDVIIFGTGVWYRKYRSILSENTRVVALLDNNSDKWGRILDGCVIQSPENIKFLRYDKILILCKDSNRIKNQLINFGVLEQDI